MSISPLLGIDLVRTVSSAANSMFSVAKSMGSKKTSATQASDATSFSSEAKRLNQSKAAESVLPSSSSTQANLAAFSTELRKVFSENGIDTTQEIDLKTNELGKIEAANDHPDKAKIEALFEENPELAAQFQQLSSSATAEQLNSKSAAAQYAQASTASTQFHLVMQNETARTYFASV